MGFSGTWASVFLVTGILTWTNQNLNQKHFRLQRKTTKMYRILNKYPSHGVMSRSHESLRCRIPWVSRTERGHTFLTTPVTPECIRFPKCVHRVNRFLAGQNKPHRESPALQQLHCFQLHLSACISRQPGCNRVSQSLWLTAWTGLSFVSLLQWA